MKKHEKKNGNLLRKLTDNLSQSQNKPYSANNATDIMRQSGELDNYSMDDSVATSSYFNHNTQQTPALLYKNGYEIGDSGASYSGSSIGSSTQLPLLNNSSGKLGSIGFNNSIAESASIGSRDTMDYNNNNNNGNHASNSDDPVQQFLSSSGTFHRMGGGAKGKGVGVGGSLANHSLQGSIGGGVVGGGGSSSSRSVVKLVSGSQFRNTQKEPHRCQQCDEYVRVQKLQKENIRSLKLQVQRLEEQLHLMKLARAQEREEFNTMMSDRDNSQRGTGNRGAGGGEGGEDLDKLQKKVQSQEEDITKYKKLLSQERKTNEQLQRINEEAEKALGTEISETKGKHEQLLKDYKSLREKTHEAEKKAESATKTSEKLKSENEKLKAQLQEIGGAAGGRKKSQEEIDANTNRIKELAQCKKELEEALLRIAELEKSLAERSLSLTDCQSKLETTKGALSAALEEKNVLDARLQKADVTVMMCRAEVTDTKAICASLETEVSTLKSEREASTYALLKAQNDAEAAVAAKAELVKEVQDLLARIEYLRKSRAEEMDNVKKALDKAITASVRLCVVAPTVNVHVADNRKMKFKSKISSDDLSKFLDNEVLTKYSFLFRQATDTSSPSGSNLEEWLQQMLAQMQTSIESHVNSAMDGSSM